jgi:hypothetical protein
MTNQEINEAIGRAIGLVAVCDLESGLWHLVQTGTKNVFGFRCGLDEDHAWRVCCPNYCTDLNPMHEAEKTLRPSHCERYHFHLTRQVPPRKNDRDEYWTSGVGSIETCVFHATARQRAEAFLRTIGKWKESK